MKNLPRIFIGFIFFVFYSEWVSCDSERSYAITTSYIKGTKEITRFKIAELESCNLNEVGYPMSRKEKVLYCCEARLGNEKKKIYFDKYNKGYKWTLCTVDFSYVEADSLKNLSEKEKLARIHSKGSGPVIFYDIFPLKFESGKCYHIFGLEGMEGSYYVYLNSENKLVTKYYAGPY